jgi:hypothetical protein
MEVNQEKMDSTIDANNENSEVLRGTLVSRMDIHQARTKAIQEEMKAKIDIRQERMGVCLEKTGATDLEANPEEKQTVVQQQEVSKEEPAVKTLRLRKKRYGDRHLAVGRHRQSKKQTQGNGGSLKKLAVAHRRVTRPTGVARRKGHGHRGPTVEQRRRKTQSRDNIESGTSKGRTVREETSVAT